MRQRACKLVAKGDGEAESGWPGLGGGTPVLTAGSPRPAAVLLQSCLGVGDLKYVPRTVEWLDLVCEWTYCRNLWPYTPNILPYPPEMAFCICQANQC